MEFDIENINKIKDLPIFFIIGSPRSGTTLLRTLFDAHPHISIPLENPFILNFYNEYHLKKDWTKSDLNLLSEKLFETKLKEYWSIEKWKIEKETLARNLLLMEGRHAYSEICKMLIMNFHSIFPKNELLLLGDKVPVYSYFIPKLQSIFPQAKFIHITRDYRDHIRSLQKVNFGSHLTPLAAMRWEKCQRTIEKQKVLHPENFYTIRYEDLVSNPEAQMKNICGFLNIEYLPEMITFYTYKEKMIATYKADGIELYHSSLLQPINNSHIMQWKTKMPEKEIKIADMLVGSTAEKYGYERKYKGSYPLLYFYIVPIYLHFAIQWFLGLFIRLLPHKTKNKIVYRRSIFENVYEKIYLKFRGLKVQEKSNKKP